MSYKNPALIAPVDNKGFLNAIDKAANSLKQTGQDLVDNKKKEEGKEAQNNKFLIKLSNDKEANAAVFNEGLTGITSEMADYMKEEYAGMSSRAFEIQKEQQINGNADPALSKELAQINLDMTNINGLSEDIFGTMSVLPELIANRDQVGKTLFIREDEEGSAGRNEAIIYGFGGVKDYKRGMRKVDGKTMAYVITPEGKEYNFDPLTFKSLVSDLTMEHENTAVAAYDSVAETIFKGKSTDFQIGMVLNTRPDNQIVDGRISNNQIQELDTAKIERAKDLYFDDARVALQTATGFKQSFNQSLIDLNINPKDWKALNGDERKEEVMLKKATDELFYGGTGVEAIDTGVEDDFGNPTYIYQRVLPGTPRKANPQEINQDKFNNLKNKEADV
jgi:hypothetical protein